MNGKVSTTPVIVEKTTDRMIKEIYDLLITNRGAGFVSRPATTPVVDATESAKALERALDTLSKMPAIFITDKAAPYLPAINQLCIGETLCTSTPCSDQRIGMRVIIERCWKDKEFRKTPVIAAAIKAFPKLFEGM